jgi:O-antigen/teichoic acid export membrane protein
MSNVIGTQYLIPTKRQRVYTSSVLIGLVINFVLNWILILKYKSVGACIATIICEAFVLGIQLYYLRNELHLAEIFQQSRRYVLSSIVMYAACYFVRRVVAYGIVSVLLQVAVGAVVYMAMLMVINRMNKKKKHAFSEE